MKNPHFQFRILTLPPEIKPILRDLSPLLALALLTTACSGRIVESLDANVEARNGQNWAELSAQVNLGRTTLRERRIPVTNPQGLPLGEIQVAPGSSSGRNRITASLNLSEITRSPAISGRTLPNGRNLPRALRLQSQDAVIGFPIAGSESRIYIGVTAQNEAIVGLALNIPGLNTLGAKLLIPVNLFLPIRVSPTVSGAGGVYTSFDPQKNGIGLFVRVKTRNADPVLNLDESALSLVHGGPVVNDARLNDDRLDESKTAQNIAGRFFNTNQMLEVR